ncbi:MAG: GWxTD domain-containing protein, partial [Acidobacteriota bacterium]
MIKRQYILKRLSLLMLALLVILQATPAWAVIEDTKDKRKKRERKLEEGDKVYKRWMENDVAYILTPEEKAAFKKLQTDEEREQFIEQFWLRRDPDPDTPENEY